MSISEPTTEHHLGDVPITTVDGRQTAVHIGHLSAVGDIFNAGEFDLPPAEPVVLVGEIPWELRDDE
ncbi:hypothetical protein [Amnibacterium sp.]|uniref:hypothetical protein n=1 Tax=Amnibacterium sp. TaxID=1872496 RepID=UPI003F7B47D4